MAELTSANINDLPDSDFAYIEPGGKVVGGKTEPRSLRHFPIHDAAHVRNALARLSGSPFEDKARPKVEAAAKRLGIGEPAGKAFLELKAEDFTSSQLDSWLAGERARRILVIPFGGPIPSADGKGRDLDGEYFDDATDLYGPFPGLRASRSRMVDWHHDDRGVPDPRASKMKGAIIGRIDLDENPEDDGYWADWWAKAGERRLALVKSLEKRGVPLYGSSEPLKGSVRVGIDGHIDLWPLIRHTITTSPQNTWAAVPPLKAFLDDDPDFSALRAVLIGLDPASLQGSFSDAGSGLRPSGEPAGKAGRVLSAANEAELRSAMEGLQAVLAKLDKDKLEELGLVPSGGPQ